ncbi:cytochrome c oxidase subunit 3 [Psychroflexus maritimus]|uniref:Heme-copper oxidase subunit III n=1 Tax=Psychroflexus maritimus TaxID=2714865 RepID=A0A967E1H4_9FLAO|nr:cytochrome c oxidase subunit 3 [Psychroflexus maritimus]NGZ88789.1 heme-copper oxidase subunit III [Psychroflexus maritimus]
MGIENRPYKEKFERSRKMMLWFGIISLSMTFAGLMSAFIVSSARPDWDDDFRLPDEFFWSTAIIILSSITLMFAKKQIKAGKKSQANLSLLVTFVLGLIFVILQFIGFNAIIELGYRFTGAASNVTASYIYLIVFLHLVHILSGLVVLSVMIFKQFKGRYTKEHRLGFEIGATFWHFVDVLWLLLFLFFSYFYIF